MLFIYFFMYDCKIPRPNLSPAFTQAGSQEEQIYSSLLLCFCDERTYVIKVRSLFVNSGVLST